MIRILFSFVFVALFLSMSMSNAQEPLVGDNPPSITITPSEFGVDSVFDILQTLQFNLDKAQANLDSLIPVSTFTSAAHRAAFYQAAAQLKKANVAMFSYMAGSDPNNRLSWIQKARQSKRQCEIALGEYYKSLPSEELQITHTRMKLDLN